MTNSLDLFHPEVKRWFEHRFHQPTDIQSSAWPRIAGGEDLLITAPTGSGKTLTAFLWAINQFVTGELETGTTRVLYISPLKALNNDIQRNLWGPLAELKAQFEAANLPFPDIRVQTRSGDTEASDRRRMLRQPPEILITTPESLNLLLSSRSGLGLLGSIRTVILDEIHGVVGNKRGTYLMSAVERLVPLSGEFQRIALSATVKPLTTIAAFVGGYRLEGTRQSPVFAPRPVAVVDSAATKRYEITIRYPESAANRPQDEKVWDSLATDFVDRIGRNRSTLIFVNSRALCETLTFKINTAAGRLLAWAHHGSLSKELRFEVEQKLKAGELAAIVATSTLEMGIDIGSLDEVILVQAPESISSSIQRIGRAGHSVGETSRCTVYPTHPLDFIEAAVLAKAVGEKDIESIKAVECPLDVLAQIMVSMTGMQAWDLDDLFNEIRRSTAFHLMSRRQFDLTLNMLAGRYADHHVRELRPRVNLDRLNNTVKARPGATLSLYLSGGVIPDRGYFQLRLEDNNARIGELDEEFVWEATVGKVFSFGTQNWQVRKITHNDVIVVPGKRTGVAPPFWKAEPISRDFHYASRVGEFLEHANTRAHASDFDQELMSVYHMDSVAARELRELLMRQREHTKTDLPHRHHLLVEKVSSGPARVGGSQVVLHTGWGARVNRPLAMALEAGWHSAYGEMPEIYVGNQSLVIQLMQDVDIEEVLALAPPEKLEQLLRIRLEGSGFFGARFRENAGRALLLSKGRFNERKPLWMSRLQSQKLLEAVLKYDDFPLLLETWRTCLRDEFDLASLRLVLDEVNRGEIALTEISTKSPSPFAHSVAWGQINTYMYMNDSPKAARASNLRADLLHEVVFNPELRPPIPVSVQQDFEARRQRLLEGYQPEGEEQLLEWVKERTAIPMDEWLWAPPTGLLEVFTNGDAQLIVAKEDLAFVGIALSGADSESTLSCLSNWLQYYGPISTRTITEKLGMSEDHLVPALLALVDDQTLVSGQLTSGDSEEKWCDASNYETLLRFMRTASRVDLEPLPLQHLPAFLMAFQSRTTSKDSVEHLFEVIERLRGYGAPAPLWETEILPARLPTYSPLLLDTLFQEGNLLWIGDSEQNVAFHFEEDLDLVGGPGEITDALARLFPDASARLPFGALLDRSGTTASELCDQLWQGVWSGMLTNDTIGALRKGIETNFTVPEARGVADTTRRRIRRGGFSQWRNAIPFSGNWYVIDWPDNNTDLLEQEEQNKDKARILLNRYGVLFRELLQREAAGWQWRDLFRSLRLMELSGEVMTGYFFCDIPGPQFVSADALRMLERPAEKPVFWINATDPVSLCGMGIDALQGQLPRRIASNHLVYEGGELLLVSERNGKSLTIHVPPGDARMHQCLGVLRHLLYRGFQPQRKLVIETINGQPAVQSPYMDDFRTGFEVHRDHKFIYIEREFFQGATNP